MSLGLVGTKLGMTRVFNDDGVSTPVTVVEVQPNRVTQVKTLSRDGYCALQMTTGSRRDSRVTAPMRGHFEKAQTESGRGLWEFRVEAEETEQYKPGDRVGVALFSDGQKVDVKSVSRGMGFYRLHEALRVRRRPRDARKLQSAPQARIDWSESDSEPCISWQEDGWAFGQCQNCAAESGNR